MKCRMMALVVFSLPALGVGIAFANMQQPRSSTHVSVTDGNFEWTMNHRDDGGELRIRVKGKPEFTDDYSDIKTLPPRGSVRVEETRGSVSRRWEVESDANGNLRRSYALQGKSHEFDSEARQWLSGILLEAVRQSGFDAERRVDRLFQKGGANAVFEEVSLIKGDYAKGVYLRELMKVHDLDSASAQRVMTLAAREMKSDYEKRRVLSLAAEKFLNDQNVLTEFGAATATIGSDYERGQTIAAALKRGALTTAQLKGLLQSVAGMSSDYEKAQALIHIAGAYPAEIASEPAFFDVANGVKSDYEHSRVLLTLLRAKPNNEALNLTLKSVTSISSDYEKARVLIQVAALSKDDENLRNALVEAARKINSDYERGRVLSAAFK
ncbi:MAG TPA: hypothetical protein VJ810_11750 [Blastocatellia bacterium]|nr:hypothetical protein [Blastocatellia bacterium]